MILFHLNKSGKFNSPTLQLFLVSCIVMRNNSFDSKKSDNNEDAGRSLTVHRILHSKLYSLVYI